VRAFLFVASYLGKVSSDLNVNRPFACHLAIPVGDLCVQVVLRGCVHGVERADTDQQRRT